MDSFEPYVSGIFCKSARVFVLSRQAAVGILWAHKCALRPSKSGRPRKGKLSTTSKKLKDSRKYTCKHPNLDHDIQQWEVNETAFSEGVEKETRNMLKK